MNARTVLTAASSILLFGGLLAGTHGAQASAPTAESVLPGTIWVESQFGADGRLYFELTAQEGLPAMLGEETLVIDYSTEETVTFSMIAGAKLLADATDMFKGAVCETSSGSSQPFTPTDKLTCRAFATPLSPSEPTRIDFTAATKATNIFVTGGSITPYGPFPGIDFTGGSGPDYVQGGDFADVIDGADGNDSLFGGRGRDTLQGGPGNDDLDGEEDDDAVTGEAGDDYVVGGPGVDVILGGSGVDTLDSQDGIADTRVDCQNDPGEGGIFYDEKLDVPYDCPVTLLPSAPQDVRVGGSGGTLVVDWSPPAFDGNAPISSYVVSLYVSGFPYVDDVVIVPGEESSAELTRVMPGTRYFVVVQAQNSEGEGPPSDAVYVTPTNGPAAPNNVTSSFLSFKSAILAWEPPPGTDIAGYEIAIRSTNRKDRKWLKWTTLPNRVSAETNSVNFGSDLKLLADRRYQFRVRTISSDKALRNKESAWVASPIRYARFASTPEITGLKYDKNFALNMSLDLVPKKAWLINDLTITSVWSEVIGVPETRSEGTFQQDGDSAKAQFVNAFGNEEHKDCSFTIAFDAGGGLTGTRTLVQNCYIRN